ncbi:MAG TPA: hypothetical protein VHH54_04585 [Actinomycetota bacterium]|nr:hypothetical protein [Actinomycetota bacterium]
MPVSTKVVLIGGYARSGSTLLGQLLGQLPEFVFVGELGAIWDQDFATNRLCGCGARFNECPFWTSVVSDLRESDRSFDLERVRQAQHRVARWWRVPQLRLSSRSSPFGKDLAYYRGVLGQLYASIVRVSRCGVVVDSTKVASHGFVLARINGVALYPIHLVRDSSATAYSLARRKKFNPSDKTYAEGHTLLRAAVGWSGSNLLAAQLQRVNHNYRLLTYDQLARDPLGALSSIAGLVGEPSPGPTFLQGSAARVAATHALGSNPIKFQTGDIEIRPDDEWRQRMSGIERGFVRFVTWPVESYLRRALRDEGTVLARR